MIKDLKYQNDIMEMFDVEYIYENNPIKRLNPKLTLEDKKAELEDLKISILNIDNCDLKANAKNLVFGDGDENSKIMIVGEGPGQKEDAVGKPFVGDAGLLLTKMLNAINLNREDIYITNVVNYRPPGNRKPDKEEIIRYSKFLMKHISIVNPKILILMGSTAMEALLGPKLKITEERGKWKEIIINNKKIKAIVTFHPAYLLRQPEKKKYSWEDLKLIKESINKIR